MPMTNYTQNQLASHTLGGGTWAKPAAMYVALFTSAIAPGGTGTEVSGGSYARVALTQNDAQYNKVVGSTTTWSNINPITFPTPTGTWGSISYYALFDASTGGNMIAYEALPSAVTIDATTPPPSFAPSNFSTIFS
jgi:hypothetical protein